MNKNKRTIIAEIGLNHNGNMDMAKCLIDEAKSSGADIAKFQFFDASKYFPPEFEWMKSCMQAKINFSQAKELRDYCEKKDIEFMASAFDLEGVDWCLNLGVDKIKVASRCIHQSDLIRKLESCGKDLIVSLGFWEDDKLPEIKTQNKVDYLFCVSKYPTLPEDINFENIDFYKKYSGFSDHTVGIDAPIIAMARGAKIIEKHFTLSTQMHGPDHKGSCTPNQLRKIVQFAREVEKWA
jgi:sialic acid synthase SpsE